MKKINLNLNFRAGFLLFFLLLFLPYVCKAMPPGTLLYRTSSDGKMFGYSSEPLLEVEKGLVKHVNSGHAAIYIGKENGVDYIVEALGGGIVKTPAQYFVNTAQGEKFLGAKIPRDLNPIQQAKVVALAKSLAGKNLGYDFDFKKQKGPESGQWTCVGLTEKLYESANISNPNNLAALEYDPNYYAINITADGYDNKNVVNSQGDCFAKDYEFSKIARRTDMLMPAPELIGYDAGLEYKGERYIFMPYTQFLQKSLDDVNVDINLADSFNDEAIRGKNSMTKIALRWSLINNPLSSIKTIANKVKEVALNLTNKLFGNNNETALVLNNEITSTTLATAKSSASTSKTATTKTTATTAAKKTTPAKTSVSKTTAAKTASSKAAAPSTAAKTTTAAKTSSTPVKTTAAKMTTAPETVARLVDLKPTITVNTNPNVNSSSNNGSASVNIASNQNNSVVNNSSNSDSTNNNDTTNNQASSSATSTDANATSTEGEQIDNTPVDWPKLALIKRIYSTGENDWVELFNPTDHDFDLKAANFRLEKQVESAPSILMRIGELSDGSYPGGTLIKAHDSYLIVRDDANSFYLSQADAIATDGNFTWGGNGYTLYLGDGAISSSSDVNILDAVGFGNEAKYFLGSGPAPEIIDNYVLTKIASTSDNAKDFSLVLSNEPGLIATSSEASTTPSLNTPDWEAFMAPTPIHSDGLSDLWHFDECYGNNIKWVVGKWGCGLEINAAGSGLTATLTPAYDLDNLSLSFNYKRKIGSRIIIDISNSSEAKVSLSMNPGFIQISGLPGSQFNYFGDYLNDDLWHQAALVVNREVKYWALYIDGQVKIKQEYEAALPDLTNLKVWTDNGPAMLDELALWHRSLSETEIQQYYSNNAPFSPVPSLEAQKAPVLKHFWHFNEGQGAMSLDDVGALSLNIPDGIWDSSGRLNTGILSKVGKNLSVDLNNSVSGKDYSLSFWWRNSAYPGSGQTNIILRKDDKNLFGLVPDYTRIASWFNNDYSIFPHGVDDLIPHDKLWHHLALTYDSYRYSLNFYVDGEEKASSTLIWLNDSDRPRYLDITNNNDYSTVDELGVWEGALSAKQIKAIYSDTPEFQ